MSEQKYQIIGAIGKALPIMEEGDKKYLMGFIEGYAARENNQVTLPSGTSIICTTDVPQTRAGV